MNFSFKLIEKNVKNDERTFVSLSHLRTYVKKKKKDVCYSFILTRPFFLVLYYMYINFFSNLWTLFVCDFLTLNVQRKTVLGGEKEYTL